MLHSLQLWPNVTSAFLYCISNPPLALHPFVAELYVTDHSLRQHRRRLSGWAGPVNPAPHPEWSYRTTNDVLYCPSVTCTYTIPLCICVASLSICRMNVFAVSFRLKIKTESWWIPETRLRIIFTFNNVYGSHRVRLPMLCLIRNDTILSGRSWAPSASFRLSNW